MEDRPYRDYTDLQLRDMIRDLEKQAEWANREYLKSRVADDEQHYLSVGKQSWETITVLRQEESARRQERAEKRTAGEARPPRPGGDLLMLACACRPPRRIRLKQRELNGGAVVCGVCRGEFRRAT